MTEHPLAGPVVLLLTWTLFMWIWMYAVRIPAMKKAGIDARSKVGGTGKDLDAVLPPDVQWKAHNYNHLMEQPTLFYAVCLLLMVMETEGRFATTLAWAYVGIRIAHSIVQSTSNRIIIRWSLFSLASLCLVGLVGYAVGATLA